MDPAILQNWLLGACPFLAFFAGIFIRKWALPKQDSPKLGQQLLLGIPIFLVVISPLIPILRAATESSNSTAFWITVGVIMEHGMIVPEIAADQLAKLLRGRGQNASQVA
jgi:hypothetical protein